MSKLSNFEIKWPKSVEKLENGGRIGPLRQDLPPPQKKRSAGSAYDLGLTAGTAGIMNIEQPSGQHFRSYESSSKNIAIIWSIKIYSVFTYGLGLYPSAIGTVTPRLFYLLPCSRSKWRNQYSEYLVAYA